MLFLEQYDHVTKDNRYSLLQGMKSVLQTILKKVFERPKRVDLIKETVKCTVVACLFCFIPFINDFLKMV